MQQTVDSVIASLRQVVRAETDSELASKLGVDKSTVSGWRSRGRVPGRFTKLLDAPKARVEAHQSDSVWPELQEKATAIALLRFTLSRRELPFSEDSDKALAAFLDLRPFWLITNRAVIDLRAKIDALGVDLSTAAALVIQDDLRNPATTAERVDQHLAEDFTDNPWLERK